MDWPSLAERLGMSSGERALIVNGDDLGLCRAQNLATFDGLRRGLLTSASLMVPCPWAYEAARTAVEEEIAVGVHLTLTAEWETYRWSSITGGKSLLDDAGFLPRTVAEVYAQADVGEVRSECVAQVERALAWGVDVSHVDSHMGTNQLREDYFEIYADVAASFEVPLRMGPIWIEEPEGYPQRRLALDRGLIFADDLVLGEGDGSWWCATLDALRPGVTEIFFHAAYESPEMGAIAPRDASARARDAFLVTEDSPFSEQVGSMRTVSYTEVRDLQRGS